MTDKEKFSALTEMGFTTEEALALVKGNYRTVPDPKPQDPDPKPQDPEPKPQDPEPKPAEDSKPAGQPMPEVDLQKALKEFGENLTDSITKAIIAQNILSEQQPPKQEPQDILGLMLEPKAPEIGGK